MQGFNHVAGGVVFTGIFASFTDVNIFEKPQYIGLAIFCSALPDIDHTRSLIGKAFYPLARWLNTSFGHRTITHSLPFLVGFVVFVRLVELLLKTPPIYSIISFYAILSHDVFDMCTKMGVQFFYPFSKRPAVLPANPNMRLETNDMRSEGIIFIVFCSLGVFCQPLFANGFWSQYHKAFLTYKSIQSEANKSSSILKITFIEKGQDTTKTLLIGRDDNFMIVYGNDFKRIEITKTLQFIDFERTDLNLKIEQKQLLNVSPDSLKYWLKLPIMKAEIQSSQDLDYFEGAISKKSKNVTFEYKRGFDFTFQAVDFTENLNQIKLLEQSKQEEYSEFLRRKEKGEKEEQDQKTELYLLEFDLKLAKSEFKKESHFEKGKLMDKIKSLEDEIKRFKITERDFESLDQRDIDIKITGIKEQMKASKIVCSANLAVMKLEKKRIKVDH